MVELSPEGWRSVGAQSVSDLPGAKVVGAWLPDWAGPWLALSADGATVTCTKR